MDRIKIIIVDDHPLFRQGVADALSLEPDLEVIAIADNGEDGVEQIDLLKPDVAVVDVSLPGISGQQVIRQLAERKVPTRVLVLTAYDDVEQKIQALRSGAAAFCTKEILPEELIRAIRLVASGAYLIENHVLDQSEIDDYLDSMKENTSRSNGNHRDQLRALSLREMEVLSAVTQGMSNKEIARYMGISQQTVKNHMTSILTKLGVDDRTQAAIYALQRGWVQLHHLRVRNQE